jgi:hypothetical protein
MTRCEQLICWVIPSHSILTLLNLKRKELPRKAR